MSKSSFFDQNALFFFNFNVLHDQIPLKNEVFQQN